MCGIAGALFARGSERPEDLAMGTEMIQRLTHRGPDEGYLFQRDRMFLGVRRLSIVNLTEGIQPAFSRDGEVVAVFNGEIYNWREVRRELEADGYPVRDGSDVEVIPHAYKKWGLDFPSRFNGDFAIALWDRARGELLLTRDRVGVKPLYYGWSEQGDLVFGSEIKALFAHPGVRRQFDPDTLAQFFTFWTPVDSYSPFYGIRQVECGTTYRFDQDGKLLGKHRYWEVPTSTTREPFRGTFAEAKEELRLRLRESVRLRLQADVPVGTYTSGGVDSSIINHVAYEELGHAQTETFSVTFKDPLFDEKKYQTLLADQLGLVYNEESCGDDEIYSGLRRAVYHGEAPLFRTAPIPLLRLSAKVRSRNIKVVLTGEGSDEVAWGYDIFRETKVRHFWARQPESKARSQLFRRLYAYLPQFQDPRYLNLILDFFKVGFQELDDPFYSHRTRIQNSVATHGFLSEAMRSRIAERPPVDVLRESLPADFDRRTPLEKCHYLEMRTLLNGYLLSSQGDRMLSANGVEGRFPYLDHHWIEFMATLPERFKISGLKDKHLLRQTYVDQLPRELVYRPKHAYRAPEIQAFRADQDGYVAALTSEESLKEAGVFDPARVKNLLHRIRTTSPERHTTRDNLIFCEIVSTQMLHDLFVRGVDRPAILPGTLSGGALKRVRWSERGLPSVKEL